MISFYKEYFEIELRHASAPDQVCTSFSITPSIACQTNFKNFRMKFKESPGEVMIFYSGKETFDHSDILVPFPEIPDNTEFVFIVSADDKSILKNTKLPTQANVRAEDIGKFVPWQFIQPAIFSITFDQTASVKLYEDFIITSEADEVVYKTSVIRNDAANKIYECSVDLSMVNPGIYIFSLGAVKKKIYVDTTSEIAGNLGFIRYKKDAAWLTPVNLNFGIPIDYNQFVYTFEAAA